MREARAAEARWVASGAARRTLAVVAGALLVALGAQAAVPVPGTAVPLTLQVAAVLVVGHVLHDWDLSTKKMLLKKSRDALPAGGALIVYDMMIDDARRTNVAGIFPDREGAGPSRRRGPRRAARRVDGAGRANRGRGRPS